MDMGYVGICYATGLMFITKGLIILYLYKTSDKFPRFNDISIISKETLSNFRPLLSTCLKSLLMSVWQPWAFELFTFTAIYLGKDEGAAQMIMRMCRQMIFMIPLSFSLTCKVHVGNSIGEGKPRTA